MTLLQDLPFAYSLAKAVPSAANVAVSILDESAAASPVEIFATDIAANIAGDAVGLYEIAEIVQEYCRANSRPLLRVTVKADGAELWSDIVLYHATAMASFNPYKEFLTCGRKTLFAYEGTQDFLYFVCDVEKETPTDIQVTFQTTYSGDITMRLCANDGGAAGTMQEAAATSPFVCASVEGQCVYGIELAAILSFVKEHNTRLRDNYNGRTNPTQSPVDIYNALAPSTCTDGAGKAVTLRGYIMSFTVKLGDRSVTYIPARAGGVSPLTGLYFTGPFGLREAVYTECPVTIHSKTELTAAEGYDPTDGSRVTRTRPAVVEESVALKFTLPMVSLHRRYRDIAQSPDLWVSRQRIHAGEDPADLPLIAARVYCTDTSTQYDDRAAQPQSVTLTLTRAKPRGITLAELLAG